MRYLATTTEVNPCLIWLEQALRLNHERLTKAGAAALDLLLEALPANSALPPLPWDIRAALASNMSLPLLEQLEQALQSGFSPARVPQDSKQ